MIDRKLFGTNALVDEFVSKLTKIETIDGGWAAKYLDVLNSQYWLEYVVDEKGFFRHLMIISPAPTTDELIEIALVSHHPDEVLAAATRLNLEEQLIGDQYRQKLISKMKQVHLPLLDKSEKERIKVNVQAARLLDRTNRRDILGKSYSEIIEDAEFFNLIAIEAQSILDKI